MKRKIYQVDAFTDQAFGGNPAGVMPQADGLSAEQMQLIAKEMKLSETAFVMAGKEGYDFEVRFFTPTEEVDLCGHATIATFSVLKATGVIAASTDKVVQKTKAGLLEVRFLENNSVMMRQADPEHIQKPIDLDQLSTVMGLKADQVGIDHLMPLPEIWSTGLKDILLPLSSVAILKNMKPLMDQLSDYSNVLDVIGVHAFAFDENKTLWCRNFGPACGIPEESATGTSNGALGACLYAKGWHTEGELNFTIRQGDWMGSPSKISVQVSGGQNPMVCVGGTAVTVLEGEIIIPE